MPPNISPSATLAALAYGQRIKEREIAAAVERLREAQADGDTLPPLLADAIRLPVPVLTLPRNAGRFWSLYSDFIA